MRDLKLENVEFLYTDCHSASLVSEGRNETWMNPSPESYAKSVLQSVGCGYAHVIFILASRTSRMDVMDSLVGISPKYAQKFGASSWAINCITNNILFASIVLFFLISLGPPFLPHRIHFVSTTKLKVYFVAVYIVRMNDKERRPHTARSERALRPGVAVEAMANALASVSVNGMTNGKPNGKAIKSKNQLRRAKAKAKKEAKAEVRFQELFMLCICR